MNSLFFKFNSKKISRPAEKKLNHHKNKKIPKEDFISFLMICCESKYHNIIKKSIVKRIHLFTA